MPVREEDRQRLLERANRLPLTPGVYVMKDRQGQVIYVGKSRKLKNRVSQYFQNSQKHIKTSRMVAAVQDFDYFLCDTEIEALTLENTLIKQYRPKYNIRLKDAKSYPYIKITHEAYPRIIMTRKREADKGKYFGPYSGTKTVFSVIDTLQKTLGLPTCHRHFPRDIGKERPCLYYQMGRCIGPCTGQVSQEAYEGLIAMAADLLRGHTAQVKRGLQEEMMLHAEAERYEAAARCRDTIVALERLSQKQTVVASPDTQQDVVGLAEDEVSSCVSIFYIRGGAVLDKADFLSGGERILDAESMGSFLCEHYALRADIPKQILISVPMDDEERESLATVLSQMAGHSVTLRTPERGQGRVLCDLVVSNATECLRRYRQDVERDEGVLVRLMEILGLEDYPRRIEAYDISNLGQEHLTAGMVVCEDGKFVKADYRTFKIKSVEGTDDYASMREALQRRLTHLSDESGSFAQCPDLILLDGGKGHVSVVRELMAEMEIDIPVFGMVKDDFHKTRALCTDTGEVSIARENGVFALIYRLQEEVHRYTVSRMDSAKRKTITRSSLTKIKGIGDAKAKALLAAFGGLAGVKAATEEELWAVKGISRVDAHVIYTTFHQD